MGHDITKDTYVNADEKTTKALTYDLINGLYVENERLQKKVDENKSDCNDKIKKLENRKKFDTTVSAVSGGIGGFFAMTLKAVICGLKSWLS